MSTSTSGNRAPDALADIDVVSNEVYLSDVPFEAFARLRRDAPLHLQRVSDPEMVDAVWVASTAELVREISGRPEVFSSQANGVRLDAARVEEGRKVEGGNFIMLDDPAHREKRKRVQPGFSPRALRAFEDAFRALADDIVERAVAAREFDAVEALSVHVPITAICQLLGIPLEDAPRVRAWGDAVVSLTDPSAGGSRAAAGAAVQEFGAYVLRLAAERAADPRDDLLSTLVTAPDDLRLSDSELVGVMMLLLVAGNESTRNTTSHSLIALAQHPDQLDWLADDLDARLRGSVDEMLRWASPLTFLARTALEDVELAGRHIAAGDRVAMFYCSANRDEQLFPDGDVFRLDRDNSHEHLSFGVGTHACMGSSLARIELSAVFRAFASRVARVEVIGEVERVRSSWVRGIRSLPVRVTLRGA